MRGRSRIERGLSSPSHASPAAASTLDMKKKQRTRIICCQGCRESHRKCDKETPCRTCQERQIECVRRSRFRFKHTSVPVGKQKGVFRGKVLRSFPKGRLQESAFEICDETTSTALAYRNLDLLSPKTGTAPPTSQGDTYPARQNERSTFPDQRSELQNNGSSSLPFESTPFTRSLSSLSHENLLPRREAALFRHFSQTIAPWLDVTDPNQHYGAGIPCRALKSPVLRFAILALAARHLSFMSGLDEIESLHYHSKSLQLLIPALSSPQNNNDDVLAATVILRLFEEMDDNDYQCHLSGITSMLTLKPLSETPSKLREATAWLYLRQDIYISLVTQTPPKTNLEEFISFYDAAEETDSDWAKKIVLLVARALSHMTCDLSSSERMNSWYELNELVEEWY